MKDDELFNKLWTKAVGFKGYDKKMWQELKKRFRMYRESAKYLLDNYPQKKPQEAINCPRCGCEVVPDLTDIAKGT